MKNSRKQVTKYLNPLPDKEREKEQWDSFDGNPQKEEVFWNDTWKVIQQRKRRGTVIRRLKQVAVAAAMTGALLGSYYWFNTGRVQQSPAPIASMKMKVITNTGSEAMDLVLEDHTAVTLFAASTLRYEAGLTQRERNIYLEGTALFNVQTDAARPFTVFSSNIATKVLGTTFKVAAVNGESTTKVYLYKGKVMVNATDSSYYLAPGDVFTYDRNKRVAMLAKSRLPVTKETARQNDGATVTNWYQFDNQGLPEVLDQLSAIYNVSIHYNPADLRGINFIGKIDRTDSLVNVLKDIALLNDLKVVNNGKNYSIKKQ